MKKSSIFRNGGEERTQQQQQQQQPKVFEPLEESKLYTIPNSMSHIGDKSDEYALLRKEYDTILLPHDPERSLQFVQELLHSKRQTKYFETISENPPPYDIYNCPKDPPDGYPHQWKTIDILNHWIPNDPNPPNQIYQSLCIFDYQKDYSKALNYRNHEVPFVIQNDPNVAQVVERWHQPNYVSKLLGGRTIKHRCEYSDTNQFMYWMQRKTDVPPPNWKPPTRMIRMTFDEWLQYANVTEDNSTTGATAPDKPHYYYRLIGCGEIGPHGECETSSSEYLFDELTFFQPRPDNLYIVEPNQQRGIHCRFGMTGVTAENHFDGSRNSIVVLGGSRRYILSHPDQCPNLYLYPKGHPSARHSKVDWNAPNDLEQYPNFGKAMSNEVILQAGDVLYLPQAWFHFIVSLELNYQCNTRSGKSPDYDEPISQCGF
eukprot:scaffold1426_cov83-Cylindrotheca_fusiformis.AAC.18